MDYRNRACQGLYGQQAVIIRLLSTTVDGIKIYSYYFHEGGQRRTQISSRIYKIYNSTSGSIHTKLFCCSCRFLYRGMEYPNLVLIDRTLYGGSFLEYIVVHETAHQWWYGLVGSNQVKEAWLDEGLTEYSTIMFLENKYGKQGKQAYDDIVKSRYHFFELSNPLDFRVLRALNEFEGWKDYDALDLCTRRNGIRRD